MNDLMTFKLKPQTLKGVRAVFCDIDGTLIDSQSVLDQKTIEAVKRIKDRIPFYLISGRNVGGMRLIYDAFGLDTAMISSNGAMISTHDNKVLYATPIDKTTAWNFLPFVASSAHAVSLNIYTTWHWYCNDLNNPYHIAEADIVHFEAEAYRNFDFLLGEDVMKIVLRGDKTEIDKIYALIVPKFPELNIIHYTDKAIEITARNVDKGAALRAAMKLFNIQPKNTMAIGDSIVDMTMLSETGFPVAVGNASDDLKALACIIIPSNENLGVAALLDFMVKL